MTARLLTAIQAAEQLGFSRAKTWELISDRRLRSVKIDGMRRIRQSDLDAFIAGLADDQPQEASA